MSTFCATTIAFANRKGGVAKTTSVSSLAGIASSQGERVLMVDLDTQANLTANFLKECPDATVVDTFYHKKLPIVNVRENLDILPANLDLVQVESDMDSPEDQFILRDALKPVLAKYDYIMLDCPPSQGWIIMNALNACNLLLVPMKMDTKSLAGVAMMAEACYQVKTETRINGIFFTEYDPRLRLTRMIENSVRTRYGAIVMDSKIRKCTKLAECATVYKDVMSYDPACNATVDYAALFEEIKGLCGKVV